MNRKKSPGSGAGGRNVWTIMKKEFARFFGDKKLVFTTLLLPGLLIYAVYSFMGEGITRQFSPDEENPPVIYGENMPASVQTILDQTSLPWQETQDAEAVKEEIREKTADLLLVFPEDFDRQVEAYQTSEEPAPEIQIFFNSSQSSSQSAYTQIRELLDQYETGLANKFDVNRSQETGEPFDLATKEDTTAQVFSMLLPLLLMVFLFSGCMAVVPESIAGEKERGTIATLLVTPVRRWELAVGKILSLSIIALLSGISSFAGTILSLPKLMGAAADSMSASVYGISEYLLLLGLVLSTVLVLTALMAIISSFAKSVKEAGTAVTPLMIVVMFLAITSMMGGGPAQDVLLYMIPLYNTVQSMVSIFSLQYSMVCVGVAIVSNLICSVLLAYVVTRLFSSEKVMFTR